MTTYAKKHLHYEQKFSHYIHYKRRTVWYYGVYTGKKMLHASGTLYPLEVTFVLLYADNVSEKEVKFVLLML